MNSNSFNLIYRRNKSRYKVSVSPLLKRRTLAMYRTMRYHGVKKDNARLLVWQMLFAAAMDKPLYIVEDEIVR
jgi:hypothetical protein